MNFGNLTLQHLTLSSVFYSPLLAAPRSFCKTNHFASKLKLTNFYTNFYFSSQSSINRLSITKSSFKYFTDSVIYVSQDLIYQKEFRTPIDEQADERYSFKECVFQKTRTNSDGGAIRIYTENGTLQISDSGFTICLATNNGGGIEFQGKEYNLERCCFLGCLAVNFGQACDLQGFDNLEGKLQFNSVQQCATVRSPGTSQSIFVRHGSHSILYVNSSFNHVKDMGCSFTIAYTNHLALHYSNFIDNTGHNSFWLHQVKEDDEISGINIVRNTANKELGLFTFENSYVPFVGLIFLESKAPVYFISGQLFLYQ